MSSVTDADGAEDVNDFLQRIRELGDKRDKEDEERTRKLEEEILQGRKERQARRAERARSLSPTKDSPSNAGTPPSVRSVLDTPTSSMTARNSGDLSRQQDGKRANAASTKLDDMADSDITFQNTSQSPIRSTLASAPSPSSAMPPSRAGTLSWQQRPTSRGSATSRSRPLSTLATENGASKSPRANPGPMSATEGEMFRPPTARSHESIDPSWFKETADQGLGSAAYRKSQYDGVSESVSSTGSIRLPRQSRESTTEPEHEFSPPLEDVRSKSPSRESSVRGSTWSQRYSSTASLSSTSGMGSPLPSLTSQKFELPSSETTSSQGSEAPGASRSLAMSPSQGRISPERMDRPLSPTKGLGGFVQSAMLKRSDSVNKRWSAQVNPGLSRGNSMASNRSGYEGSRNSFASMGLPGDTKSGSVSRENSPMSLSRPGSSHSNVTITQNQTSDQALMPGLKDPGKLGSAADNGFIKPALPEHLRTSHDGQIDATGNSDKSPPISPSKTMDPKRWSPTKASWLESAINKPDSPKPKIQPPHQPNWMAEVNKAKQQRGSVDVGRSSNFKEVAIGGLMRSPPLGSVNKTTTIGEPLSSLGSKLTEEGSGRQLGSGRCKKSAIDRALSEVQSPTVQGDTVLSKGQSTEAVATLSHGDGPKSKAQEPPREPSNLETNNKDHKTSPVLSKSKPATPPKKDFRSTLKARQVSGGKDRTEEPEFKNVFGKLKRTQTQNYVAPDELKDNILRGKAGLAITGGPKRIERKDEFKESIIKQKASMKAGNTPDLGRKTNEGDPSKPGDPPTPEAIAKRKGLTGLESTAGNESTKNETLATKPKPLSLASKTQATALHTPSDKQTNAPGSLQKEPVTGGKLANRFNPALAGVLARGPLPMGNGSSMPRANKPDETLRGSQPPISDTLQTEDQNSSQLTHMTKSRARGPKRRLPATTTQTTSLSTSHSFSEKALQSSQKRDGTGVETVQLSSDSADASSSRPLANITNNNDRVSHDILQTKPSIPSKSMALDSVGPKLLEKPSSTTKGLPPPKPRSSSLIKQQLGPVQKGENYDDPPVSNAPQFLPPPIKTEHASRGPAAAPRPKPTDAIVEPVPSNTQDPPTSVRNAASRWGTPSANDSPFPPRARSPIKLPTHKDEEAAMQQAGLSQPEGQRPVGLGIDNTLPEPPKSPIGSRGLPTPPLISPKSPPVPKKPEAIGNRIVSNGTHSKPLAAEKVGTIPLKILPAITALESFFGKITHPKSKISIDTQAVLSARHTDTDVAKIKTLRKQIWEISGNGKTTTVPSHQEHILFEENMYLCTHIFGSSSGTRTTETYLWCGDGVSQSTVEDAQIFSRKIARENNSKLIILAQGKETGSFFQALGGIVITRRGSSSHVDSSSSASATYMLCGRRHVGQIAFDEVGLNPESLCSGFPYIISARFGKLYLWKGKGAGADEVGCARLIGMDIGLTGEIEEVDEGQESEGFWDTCFSGRRRALPSEAGHWHLKPSCEKYTSRLFAVDLENRPKSSGGFSWVKRGSTPGPEDGSVTVSVRELVPFAQIDVGRDGVFVLDAFFEIWIIVGAAASSKPDAFRAALLFAQEYGILAVSMDDRPSIPVSRVVLRGMPGAIKSAFRKWDDKVETTRAGEEQVVGLDEALEVFCAR